MADYDSDSSGAGEDVQTNVLLGYASKDRTTDEFSQLGGRPTWFDEKSTPSGTYSKCRICKGAMSLLLQLHADLPNWFPQHERRLYVFACRKKACRRRDGSITALRAVRGSSTVAVPAEARHEKPNGESNAKSAINLGETLFGVKAPTPAQANPFSTPAISSGTPTNPFSSAKSNLAEALQPPTKQPETASSISETFAQKARISSTSPSQSSTVPPAEAWQEDANPYPAYHIDADYEYLEPETSVVPANARVDTEAGSSSTADDKAAFESSMDKTFQQFADKLAQNPEQVLRYEFAGQPLLYSKNDKVGRLLAPSSESKTQVSSSKIAGAARIPKCQSCGASRVFELQLTPHAITELEAEETGIEGMEWGTIFVGVCSTDCAGKSAGDVGHVEEWVGVQWEEVLAEKPR